MCWTFKGNCISHAFVTENSGCWQFVVSPFFFYCMRLIVWLLWTMWPAITFWTLQGLYAGESNLVSYTDLTVLASSVGWRESKNQYRRPMPTSAASLASVCVCMCVSTRFWNRVRDAWRPFSVLPTYRFLLYCQYCCCRNEDFSLSIGK
jgi:hypothetical protein